MSKLHLEVTPRRSPVSILFDISEVLKVQEVPLSDEVRKVLIIVGRAPDEPTVTKVLFP